MSGNRIRFTKMHGAGNDYIYVDTTANDICNPEEKAIRWSDRHKGIGSDGLVLICKPTMPEADYRMRIFNADGSEAMMCGNASRCIGKYLYERGLTDKTIIRLETLSGIKTLDLHLGEGGKTVESVTVDMLEPSFSNDKQYTGDEEGTVSAGGRTFKGTFVSMGNPHFVCFVPDATSIDVATEGRRLEHDAIFPERCNIEFVSVKADGTLRMRVWERGSGITLACGTGACATAVAACLTGRSGRKSRVEMDGGTLEIEWNEQNGHIMMTGPAVTVFEGDILLPTAN